MFVYRLQATFTVRTTPFVMPGKMCCGGLIALHCFALLDCTTAFTVPRCFILCRVHSLWTSIRGLVVDWELRSYRSWGFGFVRSVVSMCYVNWWWRLDMHLCWGEHWDLELDLLLLQCDENWAHHLWQVYSNSEIYRHFCRSWGECLPPVTATHEAVISQQ